VDFIIASRGGHGSFRLLKYLNWERIKQNPKPIVRDKFLITRHLKDYLELFRDLVR